MKKSRANATPDDMSIKQLQLRCGGSKSNPKNQTNHSNQLQRTYPTPRGGIAPHCQTAHCSEVQGNWLCPQGKARGVCGGGRGGGAWRQLEQTPTFHTDETGTPRSDLSAIWPKNISSRFPLGQAVIRDCSSGRGCKASTVAGLDICATSGTIRRCNESFVGSATNSATLIHQVSSLTMCTSQPSKTSSVKLNTLWQRWNLRGVPLVSIALRC